MKVNTKELYEVLERIVKGCGREMSDGDSFIFHKNGIFTYNGTSFINAPFKNLGNFAVKTKHFLKFLSKNKKGEMEVEVDYEQNIFILKDDKKEVMFKINTDLPMDVASYIPFKEVKFIEVDKELVDALFFVAPSASKKEIIDTKKIMEYIHINANIVEATSGRILARVELKNPVEYSTKPIYIKASDLSRFAPKDIHSLGANSTYVYLKDSNDVLYGFRNIGNTKFLDTEHIVNICDNVDNEIDFPPNIMEILDRLIVLSDNKSVPTLEVKENEALFTYKAEDIKYKEKLDITYKGKSFKINFEPKTLKECLLTNILNINIEKSVVWFKNLNKMYVLSFALLQNKRKKGE